LKKGAIVLIARAERQWRQLTAAGKRAVLASHFTDAPPPVSALNEALRE
jgi:hypothetical protein